jgi:lipopolysaccharide heptosyltransferase II
MTHLLILAPNWLGDAVMALPAMADIHRASPGTRIAVAARPAVAPLFALVPYVADLVDLSDTRTGGLENRGFDTALLFPNSFRSALVASRAGIPERWGYRTQWRGFLLTRAIARAPRGVHQVEYYQHLVRALGFESGPAEPRLDVPEAVRSAAAERLARAGWNGVSPLVAIAPGAAYGGAKRWPSRYFAELARTLAAEGVTTVMVGGPGDAATGREIEAHAGGGIRLLNLIGATDLPSLAGVLVHCRAVISNDSGAMHVAAALGVRVTAIFGPTDERITGPRGEVRAIRLQPDRDPIAHTVLTQDVWCRPCHLRECPIDHRCMERVTVDAVLAEARRTL